MSKLKEKIKEDIKELKRNQIRGLLNQCKPEQVKFFNRMFGNIDEMPEKAMDDAYRLCEATVKKNKLT